MKRENENISWNLLAKDVAGELTPQERDDLQKALEDNPDVEKQVREMWGEARYAQEVVTIDADAAWAKVRSQFTPEQTQKRVLSKASFVAIAAMLVVILATTFFLRSYLNQPSIIQVYTAETMKSVTLPDGTTVDLNRGSTLSYDAKFDGDTRLVSLVGEAFFDVTRHEEKPFVIETEALEVKVLGTSFNVRAYSDTDNSEVTVSTGVVSVGAKTSLDEVTLIAGDAVVYNKAGNSLEKLMVSSDNYMAWKTKEIEFNNTNLVEVFETIEEVYHISIVIDDEVDVKEDVLNAAFSHHSLNHVLESVCATFNLKYQQVGNDYVILNRFE